MPDSERDELTRRVRRDRLPFVVGVIGGFSGEPGAPTPFADREFVRVDRENFDDVLAGMTPGLSLVIEDTLSGRGEEIAVRLEFRSLADFEPDRVARQVESLRRALEGRRRQRDLQGQVESSDEAGAAEGAGSGSLLDQVLGATPEGAPGGKLDDLDAALSRQLSLILHAPAFQRLEAAWRGLRYLVTATEPCDELRFQVLDVSRRELEEDLSGDGDFDETRLFRSLYGDFERPGGEPCGVLIGDYAFGRQPRDMELLTKLSNIAATAFCPFLSSVAPEFFGVRDLNEIRRAGDVFRSLQSVEYAKWRSFRESEESRFVALLFPRVLARSAYGGSDGTPVETFHYEEFGRRRGQRDEYCWMNPAYVLGARIADAFAEHGWPAALGGPEDPARAEGLPTHDIGGTYRCPTETLIFSELALELANLGFLPVCAAGSTEASFHVVFDAVYSTAHKPRQYGNEAATSDGALSALLPCVLAMSRIAQQIMVPGAGAGSSREERQARLQSWIGSYVAAEADASARHACPLAEARIELEDIPDLPGHGQATVSMKPWLPRGELSGPVRFSVHIPP